MNTIDNQSDSVSSPHCEQCTAAQLAKFRHFVFSLLDDYKTTAQQQHPDPTGASSAYPIGPTLLKFR